MFFKTQSEELGNWFCNCDNYGSTYLKDRPENISELFRF